MSPAGGTWITVPRNQVIVGILVAISILVAGLIPLFALQAEKNQRQSDFQAESVARDIEIKAESVRVTCGILRGFDRLTPQIPLTGMEDAVTAARIMKANADRLASRKILKESMPADIVAMCPQNEGGGG